MKTKIVLLNYNFYQALDRINHNLIDLVEAKICSDLTVEF